MALAQNNGNKQAAMSALLDGTVDLQDEFAPQVTIAH